MQKHYPPIRPGEVDCWDGRWYGWRRFWKQAWSFDEGYRLLNAEWLEQQLRIDIAQGVARRRKQQLLLAEAKDAQHARGVALLLEPPRQSAKTAAAFPGRLCQEGRTLVFLEDGPPWARVELEVPAVLEFGSPAFKAWRNTRLYAAVRGEHAKHHRQASRAARKEAMDRRLPKGPGDMAVKCRTDTGKLKYSCEGVEVEVTPRWLRPPLAAEETGRWQRSRAQETTPARALRKMKEKMGRQLQKAARGEHERLVVRYPRAEPGESGGNARCAAMAQLDNPAGARPPATRWQTAGLRPHLRASSRRPGGPPRAREEVR